MAPPLESVDPRQIFDLFVHILMGEVTTISVEKDYTIAQVKTAFKTKNDKYDTIPNTIMRLVEKKTGKELKGNALTLI